MGRSKRRNLVKDLDDAAKNVIVAIITVGATRQTAAKYVKCSPSTIRAAAEQDPRFHEQLRKAEAQLEVSHLKNIETAAKENWRASVWLLERMYPDKYGPRRGDGISPEKVAEFLQNVSAVILAEVPSDVSRERILAKLEALTKQWEDPGEIDGGEE
jgi:hypothetical protein